MPGRVQNSALFRFGFNGKERDPSKEWGGLAHYDYGFRIQVPALGRFMSVDPLTTSYPMLTPYQFASNSPVAGIDLDGLEFYYYNLSRNKDGSTELKLTKKSSGNNELHVINYKDNEYKFQGGKMNLALSNEKRALLPFIDDPDYMIENGLVKDVNGIYWDWVKFNMESTLFEHIGAQSTFLLKGSFRGLSTVRNAKVGQASTNDYKKTFFKAHPKLKGKVVVHHAVEQQVAKRYPGLFTKAEINSLENLRGIPLDRNNELHLSIIRRLWNRFYKNNPNPTRDDLLRQATKIDDDYGHLFDPVLKKIPPPEIKNVGGFNFSRGLILLSGLDSNEQNENPKVIKP